jgi:hypothetical protein
MLMLATDGEKSWTLEGCVDIRKLIEDAGLAHHRLACKDWSVLETRLCWIDPAPNGRLWNSIVLEYK